MFLKMQNLKSVLGYGTHYSGAGLLLAATTAFTAPWMVAGAALITVSSKIKDEIDTEKQAEKYFKLHRDNHPFSPNLQGMVDTLYKNSKLDHHKAEIFDYGDMKAVNAGFIRKMGKPMIIVSTPLLEAFEDDEEFAVLAHEFAHASARHHRSVLPFDVISGVAKTSASLAVLGQAISTGGVEIAISAASALAVGVGVKKNLPKNKKLAVTAFATTAIGALAYFNPAILTAIVARQAVGVASALIDKSFSRTREYQADRGAVVLGANPLSLIKALRKMDHMQSESLKKQPKSFQKFLKNPFVRGLQRCFSTHPPIEKRITRLTDIAKENGYSRRDIRFAVKGSLEPLRVEKNASQGRIFDMTDRILGSQSSIRNEYNGAGQHIKNRLEKISDLSPLLPKFKMG